WVWTLPPKWSRNSMNRPFVLVVLLVLVLDCVAPIRGRGRRGGTRGPRDSCSQCTVKKASGPMNCNSQTRMTNDEIRSNDEIRMPKPATAQLRAFGHSGFGFLSSFLIRHSSFRVGFRIGQFL